LNETPARTILGPPRISADKDRFPKFREKWRNPDYPPFLNGFFQQGAKPHGKGEKNNG